MKESRGAHSIQPVLGIIFASLILTINAVPRPSWWLLLGLYGLAFGIYGLVVFAGLFRKVDVLYWLVIALVSRFALLFFFPNLSDDVYRFIWDGQLVLHGHNPYTLLPTQVLDAGISPDVLSEALFAKLNSQEHYTLYPPPLQAVFLWGAWAGGNEWFWNAFWMKCIIFIAECITIRWLYLLTARSGHHIMLLIYALNPLVILELMGNMHFEALMITGLIGTYFFLRKQKMGPAALSMLLAIGSRLTPLLTLPLLIRRLTRRQLVFFGSIVGLGVFMMSALVVYNGTGEGYMRSVRLYFQKFEFNASIYYIARFVGYQLKGYNVIAQTGPLVAAAGLGIIAAYMAFEKKATIVRWPRAVLIVIALFFAFATTVHPWYICPLVALAVLANLRFPVVWSAVIFLSYATYSSMPYAENLWLVALEYLIVASTALLDLIRPWGSNEI